MISTRRAAAIAAVAFVLGALLSTALWWVVDTDSPASSAVVTTTTTAVPSSTTTPSAPRTTAPVRRTTTTRYTRTTRADTENGYRLGEVSKPIGGLRLVAVDDLPPQVLSTIRIVANDGPYPYDRDGVIFENREGILPTRSRGYYREYTVPTPGESDRGARRIVVDRTGLVFYTGDHYDSFVQVNGEISR